MEKPIPATDMEVLKKAALAYFARATEDVRQFARDDFAKLDSDGNGKITRAEFLKLLDDGDKEEYGRIFRNMDTNGDGTLDFQEFLVVFFLYMSASVPSCDECQCMLVNIYFTCVECHLKGSSDSFDVCAECYRYRKFSHSHSIFLDNHTLLRSYKSNLAGRFPFFATQGGRSQPEESIGVRKVEIRTRSRRDDFFQAASIGVQAAGIGINVAQFCTIM